jgi:hypothetical protein
MSIKVNATTIKKLSIFSIWIDFTIGEVELLQTIASSGERSRYS